MMRSTAGPIPAAGEAPRPGEAAAQVAAGRAATTPGRGRVRRLYEVKRWMYPGGRPGLLARAMNRASAVLYAAGVASAGRAMTLEVVGHRSGRVISLPVVVADLDGERYLVSMLGKDANWVRNVREAGGRAVLVRSGRQPVRLVEVPARQRAPILRRYLQVAPGARPHVPVDRHASLEQFERIAAYYPVFRIEAAAGDAALASPPSLVGLERWTARTGQSATDRIEATDLIEATGAPGAPPADTQRRRGLPVVNGCPATTRAPRLDTRRSTGTGSAAGIGGGLAGRASRTASAG